MKEKILGLLIPVLGAIICGYVMGKLVYKNYSDNINNELRSSRIYLVENGKYDSYEEMREDNNLNNYVYYINKINGEVCVQGNNLNEEQLKNKTIYIDTLKLGDAFYYDEVSEGKLPKLKNSETGELLPNQTDIFLPTINIYIENIETLKIGSNRLEVQLTINNPKIYQINKVIIEDMETEITESRTISGKTYIKINATPTKYYDIYRVQSIKYLQENEEKTKDTYDIINESFYKEINKYEDWQNIDSESYENYMLLADIDFKGKENIKSNIKINKLITNGQVHTLKNIGLKVENLSSGLIKESKNLIENIEFENIEIVNEELSANYIGVIAYNNGDMNNVKFKDVNISLGSNANYIGCIAQNNGINISNIILENIMENARSYLILLVIFFIGIILGVIFVNNAKEAQSLQISSYLNNFVESVKENYQISRSKLLMKSILNNLYITIILWFLGSTVIGFPLIYVVIGYKGYSIGYTISSIIATLGTGKGLIFIISTMLFQSIIYIPAILALSVSGIKLYKLIMADRRRENIKIQILKHTIFSIFIFIILIISSFVEAYISGGLTTMLIKYC